MRRHREHIEIQEPPLQELGKKRSCLKSTCLTGCGCIVIFIVASLLLIRYIALPRPKELKQVPANFPANIPIYDHDNIVSITYISGRQKNRGLEIAAFVPKFILSPFILLLNKENLAPGGSLKEQYNWQNLGKIINQPITDSRDEVQIEWTELPAEPGFIKAFLIAELEKNYYYEITSNTANTQQFIFNDKKNIDGAVYMQKTDLSKKGTDYLSLTVKYPPER